MGIIFSDGEYHRGRCTTIFGIRQFSNTNGVSKIAAVSTVLMYEWYLVESWKIIVDTKLHTGSTCSICAPNCSGVHTINDGVRTGCTQQDVRGSSKTDSQSLLWKPFTIAFQKNRLRGTSHLSYWLILKGFSQKGSRRTVFISRMVAPGFADTAEADRISTSQVIGASTAVTRGASFELWWFEKRLLIL